MIHHDVKPNRTQLTISDYRFRHAGRSTINVSDVLLLARRNEGLESILRAFLNQQREKAEATD